MAEKAQEIRCLILTLKKENVLVASAAVAEILSVENVEAIADSPEWLVGEIKWRGVSVPLLSFEAAGGDTEAIANRNMQVAVLYILNDDSELSSSYIGMVISGVPHVSRFTADQIVVDKDITDEHSMIAQRVKVNGVSMSILDIDAMENMIIDSGVFAV